MILRDIIDFCGMCVVTAYGALVMVGGYVKYRNARRRAEEIAREQTAENPPAAPVIAPA